MLALKEQLAELKTIIQAQQQQLQQMSALPAQNPPTTNFDNPGHSDGINVKSSSRNRSVTKPPSANFHTVSRSKESALCQRTSPLSATSMVRDV
jgi:hypothetical protein